MNDRQKGGEPTSNKPSEELRGLYQEAAERGFAVGEWKLGKGFLAAVIPLVELEELGVTNPNELAGTEYLLEHTWPGSGETREQAVRSALESHQKHMEEINQTFTNKEEGTI